MEQSVNAKDSTTDTHDLQPRRPSYCPPREDPLRGAMIANASLKLSLRRLRGDAAGSRRTAAITRLLDSSEAIGRSLDWLRGKDGATDSLEQLGMELQVTPDAVEAVAQ
jgi:hypothetical protein